LRAVFNWKPAFIAVILPLVTLCGDKTVHEETARDHETSFLTAHFAGQSETPPPAQPVPALLDQVSRAEQVMKAFASAYPDRVGQAVLRDGDWAVPVYGKWFYYTDGKLLPEELRREAQEYDSQPFYGYPAELPEWKPPDKETADRLKNAAERRSSRLKRSQHFFDTLWRGNTKEEAYKHVKSIRFLGWQSLVHYSILEELALVEERINEEARTNPEVKQWINRIDDISAWNWRNIADVQGRSFHSYGAALDIVAKPQRGKETYWLWSAQKNIDWWDISYQNRLHPPKAVIKIFESYGFVWGGKWLFFDTMHFEYRPEILILNNIPMSGLR
jgi:hypothetical protein